MYRTPAIRIWKPKKGNAWRYWCRLMQHDASLVVQERHRVAPPRVEENPRPEGPGTFIPQKILLYWISAIIYQAKKCSRCGEEWLETHIEGASEAIETVRWLEIRV